MKYHSLIISAALCTALLAQSASAAPPPATISGPFSHQNLAVYLIHGTDSLKNVPILTLGEALEQKKVIVHETGDVGRLKIENRSKSEYVYIHSGDIVKGGKQDRTLPNGFLVGPLTKPIPLESFCVEQGRWAGRGNENVAAFSGSSKGLTSKRQKLAAKVAKSQSRVWQEVGNAQEKLSSNLATSVRSRASASSLQLTLENKKLEETNAAYRKAIDSKAAVGTKDDVVGFAFAINGEFNSSDVFSSRSLFLKMWPKLLEAASTEAISEFEKGKTFTSPGKGVVLATMREAEAGTKRPLEKLAGGNTLDTRTVKKGMFFATSAPVAIAGKRQSPAVVHRNVLSKDPDFDLAARPQQVRGNQITNRNQNRSKQQRSAPNRARPVEPPTTNETNKAPKQKKKPRGLLRRLFSRDR